MKIPFAAKALFAVGILCLCTWAATSKVAHDDGSPEWIVPFRVALLLGSGVMFLVGSGLARRPRGDRSDAREVNTKDSRISDQLAPDPAKKSRWLAVLMLVVTLVLLITLMVLSLHSPNLPEGTWNTFFWLLFPSALLSFSASALLAARSRRASNVPKD